MMALQPTIPPKIETGSQSWVFLYDSKQVAPKAAPQGVLCFRATVKILPEAPVKDTVIGVPSGAAFVPSSFLPQIISPH